MTERFGVRWHPSPLPVPAVSGEPYVRRGSPSGILAARESFLRPEQHVGGIVANALSWLTLAATPVRRL
jgi:hypothetical protein